MLFLKSCSKSSQNLKIVKISKIKFQGNFQEHTGAVTSIQVADDNLFFATSSSDGTIKIWDSQRLERNVVSHSSMTYSIPSIIFFQPREPSFFSRIFSEY